jgi:hypothetical protein
MIEGVLPDEGGQWPCGPAWGAAIPWRLYRFCIDAAVRQEP